MNRNIACFLVTFSFLIIIGCIPKGNQQVPQIKLTIRNTLPIDRKNVPVIISIDQFKQVAPDFSFRAFMVIEENTDPQNPRQNDEPIHAQVDDTDYDGESFFVKQAYFVGNEKEFNSLKNLKKPNFNGIKNLVYKK